MLQPHRARTQIVNRKSSCTAQCIMRIRDREPAPLLRCLRNANGGTELFIAHLAAGLHERGQEVTCTEMANPASPAE
jgi:hypothetical protein